MNIIIGLFGRAKDAHKVAELARSYTTEAIRHAGRADAVLAKDDRRLAAAARRHDMREYLPCLKRLMPVKLAFMA